MLLTDPVPLFVVCGVVDLDEVVFDAAWNGDQEQSGGLVSVAPGTHLRRRPPGAGTRSCLPGRAGCRHRSGRTVRRRARISTHLRGHGSAAADRPRSWSRRRSGFPRWSAWMPSCLDRPPGQRREERHSQPGSRSWIHDDPHRAGRGHRRGDPRPAALHARRGGPGSGRGRYFRLTPAWRPEDWDGDVPARQPPRPPGTQTAGLDSPARRGRRPMDSTGLRAVQQPLKDAYREHPQQAVITLRSPRRAGGRGHQLLGGHGPGDGGGRAAPGHRRRRVPAVLRGHAARGAGRLRRGHAAGGGHVAGDRGDRGDRAGRGGPGLPRDPGGGQGRAGRVCTRSG